MIPIELTEWAWRHGIPAHAIDELSLILGMASAHAATGSGSTGSSTASTSSQTVAGGR